MNQGQNEQYGAKSLTRASKLIYLSDELVPEIESYHIYNLRMKYRFTIVFLFISLCGFSQTLWICDYSDSIITKLIFADSSIERLKADMMEKDISHEMINAVVQKMKSGEPVSMVKKRYVRANADSTRIDIEVSDEGSLRINSFATEYILLKQDNLYYLSSNRYYDSLFTAPRKVFKPTGQQPVFFNYSCKEYTSTDSTCTIWVAEELPSCINPGVRTGSIKGAVLFYELKSNANQITRCRIISLRQAEKKN